MFAVQINLMVVNVVLTAKALSALTVDAWGTYLLPWQVIFASPDQRTCDRGTCEVRDRTARTRRDGCGAWSRCLSCASSTSPAGTSPAPSQTLACFQSLLSEIQAEPETSFFNLIHVQYLKLKLNLNVQLFSV